MDLANIKPAEEIIREIVHPGSGKEIGIRVSVRSIDDEKMKPIRREIQNRRIKLEQRGKSFNADQLEENNNRLLFKAMTGWDWYGKDIDFHGDKPAFNEDNVMRLFDEATWFRDQIQEMVGETKDFFQS